MESRKGWKRYFKKQIEDCSVTLETEKLHLFALFLHFFNLKRNKIESGLKRVKKKIRLRIAVSLSRKRSCICLLSNQWEIIFLHCQWKNNCLFEIMIYFSQSFWKWMVWWGWWGAFDQVWNPLRGFPIIHSSGSELALAVT